MNGLIMKKLILVACFGAMMTGCVSNTIRPLNQTQVKNLDVVCIENNPLVTVPSFENDIREGFANHNIRTLTYKGTKPAQCKNHLTYIGLRSWDLGMYLSAIDLKLYDNKNELIAQVDWKQNGAALNKWRNSKGKVFDAVDLLLDKKAKAE